MRNKGIQKQSLKFQTKPSYENHLHFSAGKRDIAVLRFKMVSSFAGKVPIRDANLVTLALRKIS
jgi:hypothetical protein